MKEYTLQYIAAVVGGVLSFLIGPLDTMLLALVSLEVIDFLCGICVAFTTETMNSEKCFKGLMKKVFIMVMVAVGQIVDIVTAQQIFRSIVVFFYIANEGMSIIENAAKMGLPIPEKLLDALEQLQGKEDDNGLE